MTYVKTYVPTLKTHVVNLKRDANDLSRDLQGFEVRGKLGSKTLYCLCLCSKELLNQDRVARRTIHSNPGFVTMTTHMLHL